MNRRRISYTVIFILVALMLSLGAIYADKKDDLKDVHNEMNQTKKELNEGKKEESKLSSQIKGIESEIANAEKEIGALQGNISNTESQIQEKLKKLNQIQAEMDEQNDNLNKRLRAMYKNGNSGFLEVLLGSENITDFMTNMDMVQKIFNNDMDVLQSMEEQHKKINSEKKSLEALQAKLEASKQEEAARQASLQTDRNKVAALKSEVAADNAELSKQLAALAAEADRITAEIQALQNSAGNTQFLGSGKLGWPVSGRITSEFTNRINPITGKAEKHLGLDIAVPTGTPIAAAEKGTVIKAGWNNSYGNMVIVDHGGGIATLYGHNSRLAVSVGTQVTRGQTIAYAGSTGMSTGSHCHFEVRVNGQYQNPRNWL